MYSIRLFYLLSCCLIPFSLFAQTPAQTAKNIDIDLYRYLQKIDSWRWRQDTISNVDSLQKANDAFEQRLRYYASEYPVTIEAKYPSLTGDNVAVVSSADGLFRIYSWDTSLGGSKVAFENVFQYKVNDKTLSNFKPADSTEEGRPTYSYSSIYTLKANDKTYYLAVYNGVFSSKDAGQGIEVFTIENGKLKDGIKLIKTHSGLHNRLSYDYDFRSVVNLKVQPSIHFDNASNTIFVPLVDGNGKVTDKYITYKFTGEVFEKVKN
ncbi:MAG: hypothetical protein ACHQIM_21885 [Sphingobacteriales bacterium]